MQHSAHRFTATANGIFLNGLPLTKDASLSLPFHSMRYVKRAEELLAKVKQEDWNDRTAHTTQDVPTLARVQMLLALASPQPFIKYNPDQPRVPAGSAEGGQWMSEGVQAAVSEAKDAAERVGRIFAHGVQTKKHGLILPVSVNPDENGNVTQANIFIGGALDQNYGHIVETSDTLQSATGSNYYFAHSPKDKIDDFVSNLPEDMKVNVIGHSWGGDTAARIVLDNPSKIENLITVDPVTTFGSQLDLGAVADSVGNWINIFTLREPGSHSTIGDDVAGLGAWNDATYGIADTTIPVNQHHEGFDAMLNSPSITGRTPLQILNANH